MAYYPFGGTRAGSIPTDKKFTGQRLDDMGLYYYGARYYDAEIGRFVSPDPTIPEGGNPQSYNRYSYCINNPLSAVDPNGLDYIFVCGSGGRISDWLPLMDALNIDVNKESIYFVQESTEYFGKPWEVQDQTQDLINILETEELTDIKLIGHSEGASAIVNVLDRLSHEDEFLDDTNVRDQLEAAVMLEGLSGMSGLVVDGWDPWTYNNLPADLAEKNINVRLMDIWNGSSAYVHSIGTMPGWDWTNSWTYYTQVWDFGAHANPLRNHKVFDKILEVAPPVDKPSPTYPEYYYYW
jgi:RHS repeat-associated protein